MGEVYLAEQLEPVRRKVAVKIIKLGMDSLEVVARFEAERQALALMNHPGIARIYDGGTTENGRPFFVMEYVAGVPLTDYCDQHLLDTRARLRLLVEVCRAVQHAHQKGVVHRDLKPSNVLVAIQDGRPVPKIIDFGVAKALDHRLAARTVFTARGQLIGTPAYMSPEQAEMTGLDIDTTSDVYSLGVILYELLTGRTPFGSGTLQRAGIAEIQRIIREAAPQRPSLLVSQLGADAATTAARRQREPHALSKEIRGDLDWITMRALEKDRTRRYPSASEMAADLERHLNDEPVTAGPPSLRYRLGKSVRRHRGLVGAIGAVLVVLLAGLGVSWTLLLRAETARRQAEYESYLAGIRAASASLASHGATAASRFLAACPKYLRGWEWDHLELRSDAAVRRYPVEVAAGGTILPSPDGVHCVVDDRSGTLRIVDLASGAEKGRWQVGPLGDYLCVFGPRGERLAVWPAEESDDAEQRAVQVWSVSDGRLLARVELDGADSAWQCRFGATGACLVCTGLTGLTFDAEGAVADARLWAWRLPEVVPRVSLHDTSAALLLDVDVSGERIAVASVNGALSIFDGRTGIRLATLRGCDVSQACFDPLGRWIATAEADSTIRLRDSVSGHVLRQMDGQIAAASGLEASPDGRLLAAMDRLRRIVVWDTWSGRCLCDYDLPSAQAGGLLFAPDGNSVITWGGLQDGNGVVTRAGLDETEATVRFWDPLVGPLGRGEGRSGSWLAFSPDGRRIAGGSLGSFLDSRGTSYDCAVRIWDAASGFLRQVWRGHSDLIGWLGFDSTGERLFSSGQDDTVRAWDVAAGVCLGALRVRAGAVVDPRGEVVAACADRAVHLLDVVSGDTLRSLDREEGGWRAIAFDPGGRLLAVTLPTGYGLWDASTGGRLLKQGAAAFSVRCLAFSPDGARLALGGWNGDLAICDAHTGRAVVSVAGPRGLIEALAFHPGGRRLVTGGESGVTVWDAERCRPLLELTQVGAHAVAFSPAGEVLAALLEDGSLRLWRSKLPDRGAARLNPEYLSRAPASALVDSLFELHPLLGEVLEALRDPGPGPSAVIAVAREMAAVRGGNPEELARRARALALSPDATAEDLTRSHQLADAACRLNPRHPACFKALGMVLYRMGALGEAVAALERADRLATPFLENSGNPETIGFLAMARARRGEVEASATALDRLRALMRQPGYSEDAAAARVLREAEGVLAECRNESPRNRPN